MKRSNNRIDAKLNISKVFGDISVKKRKEPSLPPKNSKEANKILDELWEISPVLSLCSQMQSLTGLRYSDAAWLRFDDFDAPNGKDYVDTFLVIQQKVFNMLSHNRYKGSDYSESEAIKSSTVKVYVNKEIIEVVEECKRLNPNGEYLFSNKRSGFVNGEGEKVERPMSINSASEHHAKVANKLKLNYPLGTHSWRKYFAKLLLERGASIVDIRDLLGHLSVNSTNTYLLTFDEKLKNIVKEISLREGI
ncbi:tyrosine-type recombinase/integrase [Psychromonas sp. KJ10-2]|uniref:tyrosine-type recombinase/integrase n=1 Tax=Psychromonas sp. KJ10-2 TaxID=3391822 RepID=UPI0039B4D1B4